MTVIHVSDLHYKGSTDDDMRADALLHAVASRWPDATLLVTGDMVHQGSEAAWAAVDVALWPWASAGRLRLVPGNHELGVGPLAGAQGVDEAATARLWEHMGVSGEHPRAMAYPELLCVDSCQRGSAWISRGCHGPEWTELASAVAGELGSIAALGLGLPLIVGVHHDPTIVTAAQGAEADRDPRGLFLNWEPGPEFLALLPPGAIVCCGHVGPCHTRTLSRDIRLLNMNASVGAGKAAVIDGPDVEIVRVL